MEKNRREAERYKRRSLRQQNYLTPQSSPSNRQWSAEEGPDFPKRSLLKDQQHKGGRSLQQRSRESTTVVKNYNTVIYKKYVFGHSDEQSIFLISMVFIHIQFLVHSFQNPWNFLSNKCNGSIFYYNIWSHPPFLILFQSQKKVKQVSYYSKAPFYHTWIYINKVAFGKYLGMRAGCQGNQPGNQPGKRDGNFSPTLGLCWGQELEVESITNGQ